MRFLGYERGETTQMDGSYFQRVCCVLNLIMLLLGWYMEFFKILMVIFLFKDKTNKKDKVRNQVLMLKHQCTNRPMAQLSVLIGTLGTIYLWICCLSTYRCQ